MLFKNIILLFITLIFKIFILIIISFKQLTINQ